MLSQQKSRRRSSDSASVPAARAELHPVSSDSAGVLNRMKSLQLLLLVRFLVVMVTAQQVDLPVTYSCTEGYKFNVAEQECKDINECETMPDACKGGMGCINLYGGYFCLPQSAQIIITDRDEEPATTQPPPLHLAPLLAVPAHHGNRQTPSNQARLISAQCPIGFIADRFNYCTDVDECLLFSGICQWQCVNQPGSFRCVCPEGYQLQGPRLCQDINECEAGSNCHDDQVCWNYFGGYRCYPRNPCHEPYVPSGESRCSCQSLSACRGLPPTIVYKYMSITSGRSVPADIFQIQATSVLPNMHNTFRIKAGNEGGQFFLRSSNVSGMLVMTRPLAGPREHILDLEMVTQNSALSYQSTSVLRLTVIVGPYAF
ncbi:EGF-containing fibulin-like extracellular matrix protein 1 isoform X2 [Acanthopagrus latus]|uniref:EGF-containing fibulin-like extracellular matrix protein 1 isoform X2 n=1 Tax=Acanthopagrus latus TaxID=8177 RepID=UPI00187CAD3A|nr:EGF-containing fibulin-like extracellular matrix protein 1 isoform X2 [Acanthopagrus latus]